MWAGLLLRLAPYVIAGGMLLGALLYVRHLQDAVGDAQAAAVLAQGDAAANSAMVGILTEQRARVQEINHEHEATIRAISRRQRALEGDLVRARVQDPVYGGWAGTLHPAGVGERLRALGTPPAPAGADPHRAE